MTPILLALALAAPVPKDLGVQPLVGKWACHAGGHDTVMVFTRDRRFWQEWPDNCQDATVPCPWKPDGVGRFCLAQTGEWSVPISYQIEKDVLTFVDGAHMKWVARRVR